MGRLAGVYVGAVLCVLTTACTSIKSTRITRPRHAQKVTGVPIVVQQDRWLKVTHRLVTYRAELQYYESSDAPLDDATAPDAQRVTSTQLVHQHVEIVPEIIEVGELYAVDLVRPLVGSITEAKMTFPKEAKDPSTYQYPVSLGAQVSDQTIAKIVELLPKVATKILGLPSADSISDDESMRGQAEGLTRTETDLRIEIYDVRRPDSGPVLVLPLTGWQQIDAERAAAASQPEAPPPVPGDGTNGGVR